MAITGKKSSFLEEFRAAEFTLDPALAKKSRISAIPNTRQWTEYEKLKMRLNLNAGDVFGKDVHVNIFMGPNTVFVFAAKDDKAEMFDDDVNLYPSDSLIGRFRLFLESVK
jgi:hypothetical protein